MRKGFDAMPLTAKGEKILAAMTRLESQGGYGEEKGKEVFYASANAGTITGVHEDGGGKRKRKKKRLAKAGLRRVLYLFFKAEQGALFAMPTSVKGYVTKRGKLVSAYTAKRKKAGEDQSGDLFSQAAKPKPVAEKPVPKDEPALGMEPFKGENKHRGTVTYYPGNPFSPYYASHKIIDVRYVNVPKVKKWEEDRFDKLPAASYFRIATALDKDGDIVWSAEYPTSYHDMGGNNVMLFYDGLSEYTYDSDRSTVWRAIGPVVRKMMDEAKAKHGKKTSAEDFSLF